MSTMDAQVREVCEELRGALQADGGDLEVVAVEGSQVMVRLQGACGCCPHAQITLKNGVERILREKVDESIEVVRVD